MTEPWAASSCSRLGPGSACSGASPRQALWGEAVRRVALVGLLVAAAGVLVDWASATTYALQGARLGSSFARGTVLDQELWHMLPFLAPGLWAVGLVALLSGRHQIATWSALLALTHIAVYVGYHVVHYGQYAALALLVIKALPVLALVAFHDGAPRPRRRPWLVALAAATTVELALWLPGWLWIRPDGSVAELAPWFTLLVLDAPAVPAIAMTVAAAVHLVARRRGSAFGNLGWTLALALLAGTVAALRVGMTMWYFTLPDSSGVPPEALVGALAQATLVGAAFALLATTAWNDLRDARGLRPSGPPRPADPSAPA